MPTTDKHMIIAPNVTGPTTVPNAIVALVTDCERAALGAKVAVRYDNMLVDFLDVSEYTCIERGREPPPHAARAAAIESADYALGRLGIEPITRYMARDRQARYDEVIDLLLEHGLAYHDGPGMVQMAGAPRAHDVRHGGIRSYRGILRYMGRPQCYAVAVVDFIDFNVPLHVRGMDLIDEAPAEQKLFDLIAALPEKVKRDHDLIAPMERLEYLYLPTCQTADDGPIHKSYGVNDGLLFDVWQRKFTTVADTRKALIGAILDEGDRYVRENITKHTNVRLTPNGTRVSAYTRIVPTMCAYCPPGKKPC